MVRGTPCRVITRSKYNLAYFLAEYLVSTRRKWADLVRRSIMTQIESYPFAVWGKPITKSIEISSYFQTGIGKGCRNLGVRIWSALTLPQMSHSEMYLVVSYFIFSHQYKWRKSWYILLLPGWMDNLELWASSKIFLLSSSLEGTTNRFLNFSTPWSSTLKWGHALRQLTSWYVEFPKHLDFAL